VKSILTALTESVQIKNNSDTNLEELTLDSEISLLFLWLSPWTTYFLIQAQASAEGGLSNSAGQEAA